MVTPGSALAASASSGGSSIGSIFLALAILVIAARVGDLLAIRYRQPTVLGELLLGMLVGPSVLGLVDPSDPSLRLLAEFGVVILLFQIGLHTDLRGLLRVGTAAAAVGVVGMVVPFAGGAWLAHLFGLGVLPAILCGAAMTATSIGISTRVLTDLDEMATTEGQVVLGAAVFDDVAGLVVLAVTAVLATGGAITFTGVARITASAVGFLVIALLIGRALAPKVFGWIGRLPLLGTTGAVALAFALALAAAAEKGGSAPIIGAFAAGLILHATPQRQVVEDTTTGLGFFFVPIFFALVGAEIQLGALFEGRALLLGGILFVMGVAGKLLAGYAPFWMPIRHLLVGVAMIPRGEVGLIFARMGLESGTITEATFGALMLMVVGTTFITPPWLARLAGPHRRSRRPRDEGRTMEDLIAGARGE